MPTLAPRLWAIPALALLALALVVLSGANVSLFLAVNAAARVLPDAFWACITSLGDTLPAFALLLVFVAHRPETAPAALIAVICAMLASQGLKHGLDLPRPPVVLAPDLFHVIGPRLGGRSFPSGHTTAAFTVAALLCGYALPLRLALLPVVGATLIALSRLAVGVHWPTDVLAGAAVGWLSGFAGLHLAARCRASHRRVILVSTLVLFAAGTLWLLTGFDSGYADARWLERTVAAIALLLFVLSLPSQRRSS
jgi:membrane-associated phospholipid phosphatase